jgi:hypothetical protein
MQLALLKQKHGAAHPEYMACYPHWSDDLVRRCCEGYWAGETSDPVWEYLFPCVRGVHPSDNLLMKIQRISYPFKISPLPRIQTVKEEESCQTAS